MDSNRDPEDRSGEFKWLLLLIALVVIAIVALLGPALAVLYARFTQWLGALF